MMKRAFLCFLFITFYLSSCTYEKGEPANACGTPDTVSFSNNIIPLFNTYCNTGGCHSGSSPAGNLSLEPGTAYAQLMTPGSGYIDTLNPKFSLLYAQMNSASSPMPPSGKLNSCKLELVLKWIQQKAKNN